MAQIRLALLGPPEIWCEERQIRLRTRKALALLAYLVVEERPHSRDEIGALLWPAFDAEVARNNVRVSLFYLRRALGHTALTSTRDMVGCAQSAFSVHRCTAACDKLCLR